MNSHLGLWGMENLDTMGKYRGFLFGGNENVLKLVMVMGAHLCQYTKNHQIVYISVL